MPDKDNEDTTMWVKKKTVIRLQPYKTHPRETNDETLNRLMDQVEPPQRKAEA